MILVNTLMSEITHVPTQVQADTSSCPGRAVWLLYVPRVSLDVKGDDHAADPSSTPQDCRRRWLSKEELQLAIDRVPERVQTKLTWGSFKRIFFEWRFWAFTFQFSFNTIMEWSGLFTVSFRRVVESNSY